MFSAIRTNKESVRVDASASSAKLDTPSPEHSTSKIGTASLTDTPQYWIDRGFLAPETVRPETVRPEATAESSPEATAEEISKSTAQAVPNSTTSDSKTRDVAANDSAKSAARWLSAEFHRSKQPVRYLQPHTPFLSYPADHYYRIETLSAHQKAAWTVLNTFQGDTRFLVLFTLHNQPVGAVEAILYFDKTGVEPDAESVGTASPINPKQTFLYSYNAEGNAVMNSMEDQNRQMSEAPEESPAILHASEDLITFRRDALMWYVEYFADASTRNEI